MKKLLLGLLAALVVSTGVYAASIPLLTGAFEPSQVLFNMNTLIQLINANITSQSVASVQNGRNLLDAADFSINANLWQRGTTFTSITNTLTYTADRWAAVGGASSSISVSRQTGTPPLGTSAYMRFGRAAANADTTQFCTYQEISTAKSTALQSQPIILSFTVRAGANYSPANGAFLMQAQSGTGSDQGLASLVAGTWTGQAVVGTATSVNLTPGGAFQRFTVGPATVPAGATELAVQFCMTPVGTAGAADYVEIGLIQVEQGTTASSFEFVSPDTSRNVQLGYFLQIAEGAATRRYAMGQAYTTTSAHFFLEFPVQMRVAPTTVVATVGTFTALVPAGTAQVCTALALTATSQTVNGMDLTCTVAANLVAGNASQLTGGGGAGVISASADF